MAGIYNGHLLEFPQIRVDAFIPSPSTPWSIPSLPSSSTHPFPLRPAPNAQLFLLTHVHSDHLIGLTENFTGKIICTPDTKRMLLRLEPEVERGYLEDGLRERRRLRFGGLKARLEGKGKDERLVDRIEAIPYGHPKEFELGYEHGKPQMVTITLLDANHCPGSAMFLVTSNNKAVLHTGDVRADSQMMQSLKRNPAVQEYIAPTTLYKRKTEGKCSAGRRMMDRIYLDTAAVLGTGDMPDREPVLQDLVEQMSLYPSDTIFFLNTWCFGWEHVIQAVARYFNEPVHVDRYKRSIYTAVETDPFLLGCTTTDPDATRFHACERFAKCKNCRRFERGNRQPVHNLDKRIVNVNMVEIKQASWTIQHETFLDALGKAACGEGPWPYTIDVPLARHSTLPELQNLVALFKPLAVTPNTVAPFTKGLDYFLLPDFLRDCIAPDAYAGMIRERDLYFNEKHGPGFIQRLNVMREAGLDLAPDVEKSLAERDQYVPKREDHLPIPIPANLIQLGNAFENQKQSAKRSVTTMDQLVRAGGLPRLGPGEIMDLICGGEEAMSGSTAPQSKQDHPPADRHVSGGSGGGGVDYDTDDEEESQYRKRRRRRRRPMTSESPSEDSYAHVTNMNSEAVGNAKVHSIPAESVIKTAYDAVPVPVPIPVKLESAKISTPTPSTSLSDSRKRSGSHSHSRTRFSLGSEEKQRIRALMKKDREMLSFVANDNGDETGDGD
ncbi:hypothetical protein CI109_106965 [Kwoniella shandongensis]|uniref:Metallo-beta-lactamase domain-containing protein n=1 Tax=Kwoniella shandongensis TaxID=1734106 RepID=A0AAJ8LR29_9TREE